MTIDASRLSESSHLEGIPKRTTSITRINFPSPNSIVHKRILQTEARIQGQENNGVISTDQYSKPKSPVVSRTMKGNEAQSLSQTQGLQVPNPMEHTKTSRIHRDHRRHSDVSKFVPKIIDVLEKEQSKAEEKTTTYHLDLLKDKKLKQTMRTKDYTATKANDSSDGSVSSSKERLERLGTLLTKARGSCQTVQTRISSLVDDSSLIESKTTEESESQFQDTKVKHHRHSYAGIENINRNNVQDTEHRFSEVARLKSRLQMTKSEKPNITASNIGHSTNPDVVDNWTMDPPPPPPPQPESPLYLNRLVSKETTHYIKTEYQESESKMDDHRFKVESRLCSHVRMAVQQNEMTATHALVDDPLYRLVFLAKELADQAGKIDFLQFNEDYFSTRMTSVPTLPSTSSHPMILQRRETISSQEPSSQDKMDSHQDLATKGTTMDYLLRKLQEADEQYLESKKTKEALEESLMEANNFHRDLEISVKSLKGELEEARITNTSLSDELASAKEEIISLVEGKKKLDAELERTQNRLGDVTVQLTDLELESASLREMVDEKDKENDANMVLLKDQHKSVVAIMDYTRDIRSLMTELQQQLQAKSQEDTEDEKNDPALAKEAWEDWLKKTLPKMDAMESELLNCQSQLAVKVQPPEENDSDSQSEDKSKGRWSLFRFGRKE